MAEPILVVVTGPPASGKSSIARELASALHIPFLSKDELKERLYETVGSGDEVEATVDRAALAILFSVMRSNLDAEIGVLVESNFDADSDTAPFRELGARIVQVHCGGDADELATSFAERSAAGRPAPPGPRRRPRGRRGGAPEARSGPLGPARHPGRPDPCPAVGAGGRHGGSRSARSQSRKRVAPR